MRRYKAQCSHSCRMAAPPSANTHLDRRWRGNHPVGEILDPWRIIRVIFAGAFRLAVTRCPPTGRIWGKSQYLYKRANCMCGCHEWLVGVGNKCHSRVDSTCLISTHNENGPIARHTLQITSWLLHILCVDLPHAGVLPVLCDLLSCILQRPASWWTTAISLLPPTTPRTSTLWLTVSRSIGQVSQFVGIITIMHWPSQCIVLAHRSRLPLEYAIASQVRQDNIKYPVCVTLLGWEHQIRSIIGISWECRERRECCIRFCLNVTQLVREDSAVLMKL